MARKPSKPTFFWQGVLILLPVLLMAGFGTWAILRERRAVEQDARQRAREVLDTLPYNFFQRVAFRMGFLTTEAANESVIPEKAAVVLNEEDGGVEQWGAAGNTMSDELTNVLWTSLAGELWPMNFLVDTNGEVWDLTYQQAPQPPRWLAELNQEQRNAWAALCEADLNRNRAQEVSRLAANFSNTEPVTAARECADFIRLREESASELDNDAVKKLLAFGKNCSDVATESGIPLSNLVLAEALRQAAAGGTNDDALRRQMEFEVCYRPSLLTPALLEMAQPIAGADAEFAKSLRRLQAITDARETQRTLAEQIKLAGVCTDIGTITNAWLYAFEQRWFCVLQPERVETVRVISTAGTNTFESVRTNVFTEVIPYPESFLTKSFGQSLAEARVSLPDYFGISMELEGQQIALPAPWSKSTAAVMGSRKLTEDQTNMVRVLSQIEPRPGPEQILAEKETALALPASRPDEGPHGTNAGPREFDAMPSHPRLVFRIVLADRDLLYARQRQRQIIFGSLIGFSVVAALIGFVSARRAFRTQLQLSEAKSNFVSSVSHELRAPIASVRLMAESLERGKINEVQKQNEYFRFIVQECRRLTSLIENVLDFSRIEQGRKQYEFEPTNLPALVSETVKLMEPYAAEKGVGLVIPTEPFNAGLLQKSADGSQSSQSDFPLPKGEGQGEGKQRSSSSQVYAINAHSELNLDGRAIQQALVNLIDNALKHSPKGSVVQIGFEWNSTWVRLWVEDRGPGIPPEEHEKIFERFYRLGSELRRETQGVGIGLSIVKHIVEAHGGHVTVRSSVGHGSRFTIELPTVNAKTQRSGGAKDL